MVVTCCECSHDLCFRTRFDTRVNILGSFKGFSSQGLITSLDLSKSNEWTTQCRELLATGARGLGLVFEDGVLKLDGLIAKGHQYIETDKGTEFLRNAQKKALDFTKVGLFEQANGYIQQLEQSNDTKNSRAFLAIDSFLYLFIWHMLFNVFVFNFSLAFCEQRVCKDNYWSKGAPCWHLQRRIPMH